MIESTFYFNLQRIQYVKIAEIDEIGICDFTKIYFNHYRQVSSVCDRISAEFDIKSS